MVESAPDHLPRARAGSIPGVSARDRARMRLAVLLVLAGAAAYLIARILAPFALAIVVSAVLAMLAHPVCRALRTKVTGASLAAFVTTAGVLLLVLVPVGVVSVLLVRGIESQWSVVAERAELFLSRRGPAWEWLVSTAGVFGLEEAGLSTAVGDQLSQAGSFLAGGTFGLLSGLGGWLIQGGVAVFALFYLLRDGEGFVRSIRRLTPLDDDLTTALLARTREVATATVLGSLVVALVQGTVGGLTFWALDLPGPALWGVIMALFALVPGVGPPVVWIPSCLILLSEGDFVRAGILLAVGALVIGTLDNVLRSVLVGGRAQLHSLVVFFSVLGGLVVFGVAGILLGPILFVVALLVLEIARLALRGDPPDAVLSNGHVFLSKAGS